MSIEAMKLAQAALESCAPADTSSGHVIYPSFDEKLVDQAYEAIRTAIQQAESEPVGAREALERIASWSEHPAMLGVDYGSNGVRDYYRKIARDALTHPAPGVQEGWMLVKFDDMVRLASLIGPAPFEQDGKTYTFNVPNPDENLRLISATVRAMLAAAQAQKGQP